MTYVVDWVLKSQLSIACFSCISISPNGLILVAIHFNANAGHKQAATKDRVLQWKAARPQATHGVPVAKAVKDPATRDMNAPTYHDASLRKMLTDFFLCCISYLKIRLMMDAFIPLFSVRSKHQ